MGEARQKPFKDTNLSKISHFLSCDSARFTVRVEMQSRSFYQLAYPTTIGPPPFHLAS